MTNFDFLKDDPQFSGFADAAIAAERILPIDAATAVLDCRRAMEFAVKWMYSVDSSLVKPWDDKLISLMSTEEFHDIVDDDLWRRMDFIRKRGNDAAHGSRSISREQAELCLENLFLFLDFVAYCYGTSYQEKKFDASLLTQQPAAPVAQPALPDVDLDALIKENAELKAQLTARRETQQPTYVPKPLELSEYKTRKLYIDSMLTDAGWVEGKNWVNEVPLPGMPNKSGIGYADYVLYGDDGRALAVIEAKRTCKDVAVGRQQAKLYADILEKQFSRRPVVFLTNGFDTCIVDNIYPERKVASIYSKRDLEKWFNLQAMRTSLANVDVNKNIAGRYYQEGAIKAVCDSFGRKNRRKALLVMATGSGKTRTVIALVDVLLQHGWVKNVLFLADRNSLVTQAKRSFVNLLPELSVTNLCEEKDNFTAHCVFSTYQTMMNCIDSVHDAEGKLFDAPKFEHSYPHCWRCDTPLIYYARESWFIKMTAVKDDMIRNNNTVNWIPESIGKGRFGDWLENIQDWGISRNRYWGTPLNIWECEGCGHQESIGSRAELAERSGNPDDAKVELHRPYIDAVTFKCPDCGKTMKRVPEVIDCWFDSGAMPFAQHHYPFENKDLFEAQFPAQFISEAVDQTRGWFYSLMAESTLLFNKAPYENVIVLGHVQDENGQKMSKSKGNAVDPFDALDKYGADAIRWYFYINSAPWLPNRFHGKAVQEGQRKFMGTLWNTYAFFVLYANIDEFDATKYTLEYDKLSVMDKWLLSRLNSTVKEVDENLAAYRIPETAKALQSFVDEMSNWYVRRCRERFWAKGMEQDKINAYMTLYTALVTISKAAAPMIPFMTEDIYRNLVCTLDANAPESVHLCDFPEVNEAHIDKKLEEDMETVLEAVVIGRACRNTANIKNRQPIGKMYIKADAELSEFYMDIIKDELNVKEAVLTQDVSELTTYSFKPQLKTLGRRFGKQINNVKEILAGLDGQKAMAEINEKGNLTITVDGNEEVLEKDDLLIEAAQMEGYISDTDHGITVVLDTNLTPELIEEGFVREVISKIQTMRKDAGFEVMDHICVSMQDNDKIADIVKKNEKQIKSEVLANETKYDGAVGFTKEWNINGEKVMLGVEKM